MKRMSPPAHERWRALRNGAGQWIVVDQDDREPLRSMDPLRRMEAVHVAAAAPALRAALLWLVEDVRALEVGSSLHIRHRVRLMFAEAVLVEAKAPWEEALRLVQPQSRQQELDLDLAA